MKIAESSIFTLPGGESADRLTFLYSPANPYNIDLEKTFREKEEVNKKRTWKVV